MSRFNTNDGIIVTKNCPGDEDTSNFINAIMKIVHTIISEEMIFILGFISSILSACLGLAKAMRLGICRTMADSNSIDIFTGRFLMAFLSCGLVGVSKGFMIALVVLNTQVVKDAGISHSSGPGPLQIEVAAALCLGLFLPQLFLALWSSVGASKTSLKTIIHHPFIIILPMFTFFTFAKMNTFCGDRDVRIKFNSIYTWMNMILSSVYGGILITVLSGPGYNNMLIGDSREYHPATFFAPFCGGHCLDCDLPLL